MAGDTSPKFKAAAVHAASPFLDREAGVAKTVRLIDEAAGAGAKLIVFPETFIPGYPFWIPLDLAGIFKTRPTLRNFSGQTPPARRANRVPRPTIRSALRCMAAVLAIIVAMATTLFIGGAHAAQATKSAPFSSNTCRLAIAQRQSAGIVFVYPSDCLQKPVACRVLYLRVALALLRSIGQMEAGLVLFRGGLTACDYRIDMHSACFCASRGANAPKCLISSRCDAGQARSSECTPDRRTDLATSAIGMAGSFSTGRRESVSE